MGIKGYLQLTQVEGGGLHVRLAIQKNIEERTLFFWVLAISVSISFIFSLKVAILN